MENRRAWTEVDLEVVSACPICTSSNYKKRISNVEDFAFEAAPGKWEFSGCVDCESLFLNPRPTEESIALAYEGYYTHVKPRTSGQEPIGQWSKIRRSLRNSFLHHYFSWDVSPRMPGGWLLVRSLKPIADHWNRVYRHMPKTKGRLLDIGCGDGAFLTKATEVGWESTGVDFDARCGANSPDAPWEFIAGTAENLVSRGAVYDHITLCHSLEHVHDPRGLLAICFALLAPGGTIWMELPRANAGGLLEFGKYWRGLEAPRHISLPSSDALKNLLTDTGFENIRDVSPIDSVNKMAKYSDGLRRKHQNGKRSNSSSQTANKIMRGISARLGLRPIDFIGFVARRPVN